MIMMCSILIIAIKLSCFQPARQTIRSYWLCAQPYRLGSATGFLESCRFYKIFTHIYLTLPLGSLAKRSSLQMAKYCLSFNSASFQP